jgi:hypothetical protein
MQGLLCWITAFCLPLIQSSIGGYPSQRTPFFSQCMPDAVRFLKPITDGPTPRLALVALLLSTTTGVATSLASALCLSIGDWLSLRDGLSWTATFLNWDQIRNGGSRLGLDNGNLKAIIFRRDWGWYFWGPDGLERQWRINPWLSRREWRWHSTCNEQSWRVA